jgi:hypothetical protein
MWDYANPNEARQHPTRAPPRWARYGCVSSGIVDFRDCNHFLKIVTRSMTYDDIDEDPGQAPMHIGPEPQRLHG